MANYCFNNITFYGEKENLNKLKKALSTYPKCEYFTLWVREETGQPIPEEGEINYYEFGTKWFEFEITQEDDATVYVSGDSAWSPPVGMVEAFCKAFQLSAEIEYEEPGMDFAGKVYVDENGERIEEFQTTYLLWRYQEDKVWLLESLVDDFECGNFTDMEDFIEHIKELPEDFKKEVYEKINKDIT